MMLCLSPYAQQLCGHGKQRTAQHVQLCAGNAAADCHSRTAVIASTIVWTAGKIWVYVLGEMVGGALAGLLSWPLCEQRMLPLARVLLQICQAAWLAQRAWCRHVCSSRVPPDSA